MNNSYKLVYSEALNAWVAVSEHVSARGKKGTVRLLAAVTMLASGALSAGMAQAGPPIATQLPTGAQVVAGSVNISQTQTAAAASMAIAQSSQQAIVNWQSFNVGANAKVNITQPNSSSVLLNRVLSSNPSQIFGQINANGQVMLVNPNGVYFAAGSSVNVGSFTATTHSITDADFLKGNYQLNRNGATGSVVNEGSLKASLGGYIALLAPEVRNQGVVLAQMGGTVALAAGESFQLQFGSNNQLTNVLVTPATIQTLVDNGNAVQAPGGLIILSAQAANGLLGGVVKNSGAISATGLVSDGGTIRLSASHKIELAPTSSIMADAAANSAGNGGRIDIIADLSNASSSTQVDGTISAKGGELGGDGGFVETSAARLAIGDNTLVNTGAPKGQSGTWLLDPYDVTIVGDSGSASGTVYDTSFTAGATSTILASAISASLEAGTNVTISTGTEAASTVGSITVNAPISWSTARTLTLSANYNININAAISATATTGAGVALVYNQGNAGGAYGFGLSSTGFAGNITFGGNADTFSTKNYTASATNFQVITSLGATSSTTAGELYGINGGLGLNYALGSNITVGGAFNSLARTADLTGFTGQLDGLGHTIFATSLSCSTHCGFFQSVTNPSIQNLGLNLGTAGGSTRNGGLVGYLSGGTIANVFSSTSITGADGTGGLIGYLVFGTLKLSNSYSTGSVTGTSNGDGIGGLIGWINGAEAYVFNSYATGAVSGAAGGTSFGGLIGSFAGVGVVSNSFAIGNVSSLATYSNPVSHGVGGLIGTVSASATVLNSYATGSVTASNSSNVGGLVGYSAGKVINSYSTGSATGSASSLGGLIGNNAGTVTGSYWNTTTSGLSRGIGAGIDLGATGLLTSEMQQQSSFTSFDFSQLPTWAMGTTGNLYPVLTGVLGNIYLGANNGSWSTSSNWSLGSPSINTTAYNIIVINTGRTVDYDTATAGSQGRRIYNAGVISFSGTSPVTLAGTISGSGALIKTGTSVVTLAGTNTYTGGTTISAGKLAANNVIALSTGAVAIGAAGTLDLTYNGTVTLGSTLVMSAGAAISNSANTSGLSVAGTSTLAGTISTAGSQTYTGAVTLGAASTLSTVNSSNANTNANVSFGSTVNGPYALTVINGSGATSFSGAVGSSSSIGSLVLNGTGAITLNSNVTSTGNQTYTGAVTLGAASTLSTVNSSNVNTNANVSFGSSVDGPYALTITNGNGNVSFGSTVGASAPLASLTVTGGVTATAQTTTLGGNVTTTGNQSYGGNLTLGANTVLSTTNSDVTIAGGVTTTSSTSNYLYLYNGGTYTFGTSAYSATNGSSTASTSVASPSTLIGLGSLYFSGGTFTLQTSTNSAASILIVGGGGGGPGRAGGGAGAGGLVFGTTSLLLGSAYSIVVGSGGVGGAQTGAPGGAVSSYGLNGMGSHGYDSTAFGFTAGGGGTGNNNGGSPPINYGGSGGGGTGSGGGFISKQLVYGLPTYAATGLGNDGGAYSYSAFGTGGGGGAGAAGSPGKSTGGGGNGGAGYQWIDSNYYAGGGGGSHYDSAKVFATGGIGGGGAGANGQANAQSGVNGTGGGGGGAANDGRGGAGGTGIVALQTAAASNAFTLNINSGTGKVSIGGSVANNSTLTINSTSNLSGIAGPISGTTALIKSGAGGILTLSGTNTYTGATTVSAGTLAVTNVAGLGATSAGTTVASGATLDLRNVAIDAEAITLNGGTLATSTGTSSLSGAVTLGASSALNVTGTQLTLSSVLTSPTFGLALLGTGSIVLNNTANALSTIATDSGIGAVSVVNGSALTIGQVTTGGTTYSGISSTDTVAVETRSGDLTVSQSVSTTSTSSNTSAPALKLSAGSSTSAGTSTGGNIVLSGSPNFLVGTGGISVFYSGSASSSSGLALADALSSKTTKYVQYNKSTSNLPSSGAGYYALFRESPTTVYLLPVSGQSSTYGTAPTALSYCFSSSASACSYLSVSEIPGAAQSFSLTGSAVTSIVSVTSGVTGSLLLSGPAAVASGMTARTNASTYALTLVPSLTLAGYVFSSGNAVNYTVDKANLAVSATLSLTGNVYSGSAYTGSYTTTAMNGETFTVTGQATGTNAGTYTSALSVSGSALVNYNTPVLSNADLVISPRPVTVSNTSRSTTYNGVASYASLASGTAASATAAATAPSGTGLVGSDALASVTQTPIGYSGADSGVAQAGSFTVTPSAAVLSTGAALSNYAFSYVSSTHTVDKANLAVSATPSLSGNVYKGSAFTGSYTTTAVNGETFTVTGQASGTDAGTYTSALNVSGSALVNYNTPVLSNADLVISPRPVTVSNTSRSTTYDGVASYASLASGTAASATSAATAPSGTGLVGSDALASVTQTPIGYSGADSGVAQAGSFTVTPSAAVLSTGNPGNYSFSYVSSTHTVDKANLAVSATPSLSGNVYKGSAFTGSYTTTAVNGETFTVTGHASGTNAGTYTSTLNVSGSALVNYNTPVLSNADLVISPRPVTVSNTSRSTTYDGVASYASLASGTATSATSAATAPSGTGLVGSDALASVTQTPLGYSGADSGVAQAGSFTVTPSAAVLSTGNPGNYSFSYGDSTHTVDKANATVTANSGTLTYNGVNQTVTGFTATGLVGGETEAVFTGVSASRTAKNAGTYATTASGTDGNYNLSFVPGSMLINKAALTATGHSAAVTYNGANQSVAGLTVSGLQGTDSVADLLLVSAAGATAQNAGSYTNAVTAGTQANYTISTVDGSLTIAKANATVTANSGTLTYNGANQTVAGFTASGLVGGEAATVLTGVSASRTEKNAGSYATTASGTDVNYNLSFVPGSMGIDKAPLSVTASAASKTYDGVVYAGGNGVVYSGFVNSETSTALTGALGYAGTSQGAKNAGSYVITPNGLSSANYAVSFVDGSLRVNPAPLLITAQTMTKSFDGNNSAMALPVVSGLRGLDVVTNLFEAYADMNPGNGKTLNVKSDYLIQDGNSGANYTVTLVADQTGVIRALPVAVLAPSTTATGNANYAPPTLTVSASVSTGTGTSPPATAQVGGSSSGVSVSTINSPTQQMTGLVSVLVPSGTSTGGTGLVIALPESVITGPQFVDLPVSVSLPNGQPLPSWIRYDTQNKTLVTEAVPASAFPLSVVVTVGGQSTLIQVSESQEKP